MQQSLLPSIYATKPIDTACLPLYHENHIFMILEFKGNAVWRGAILDGIGAAEAGGADYAAGRIA
jgi:hypothetical protein